MAISKKDRDDHKQGQKDEKLSWFDKAINDITVNHPDTSAYYKGRAGKQLDGDKKDKGK